MRTAEGGRCGEEKTRTEWSETEAKLSVIGDAQKRALSVIQFRGRRPDHFHDVGQGRRGDF
jgi:hypothetical protein